MARMANEADRRKILDGIRDLAYSIESPKDTTDRIMFLVRVSKSPHHLRGRKNKNWSKLSILLIINSR